MMGSHVVWFISFQLKKGVSEADFLLASAKCHEEVLSKKNGFVSWTVLREGETWVDWVEWETAEDAKKAETAGANNPAAKAFYACLNMNSCKMQTFTVEKKH